LRQIFEEQTTAATARMHAFSEMRALSDKIVERQKVAESTKSDSVARAEHVAQDKRESLDPPQTELGELIERHRKMLRQEVRSEPAAPRTPVQPTSPKYHDGFISQWNQFGVTYRGIVADVDGEEFVFDALFDFDALIAEPADIAKLQFRNVRFQVDGEHQAIRVELQDGWAAGHAPVKHRESGEIPADEPAPEILLPPIVDTPEPMRSVTVPAENDLHTVPHWYDSL